MKQFLKNFFMSNEWYYRLARTIVQGVIAVIIANLDLIFTSLHIDPQFKAMLVALVMAILSPIMASIVTEDEQL